MPLTTVFEAGALVHHRYRTKEKDAERSCVIVAFHRAKDNPGQLLSQEHVEKSAQQGSLEHLLMGKHSDNTDEAFINAVVASSDVLASKIIELNVENEVLLANMAKEMKMQSQTQVVSFTSRELKEDEFKKWKMTVTSAPTVEAIKAQKAYFYVGKELSPGLLIEMIKYDKHGPLDLILYGDGHEEIRKWARNRIREMPIEELSLLKSGPGVKPDPKFINLAKGLFLNYLTTYVVIEKQISLDKVLSKLAQNSSGIVKLKNTYESLPGLFSQKNAKPKLSSLDQMVNSAFGQGSNTAKRLLRKK